VGNLGPREGRKRMVFGLEMLAIGIAFMAMYFYYDIRGPIVLTFFFAFWLGVMGLLQGREST
jgi:uncharacterized membrane protein HdeD (DUF308 family)